MEVRFTWNPKKAERNLRKHGVRFAIAKQVFADPYAVMLEDYIDEDGEQRMQVIGRVASQTLLLVAYIDQSTDEQIHVHNSLREKGSRI